MCEILLLIFMSQRIAETCNRKGRSSILYIIWLIVGLYGGAIVGLVVGGIIGEVLLGQRDATPLAILGALTGLVGNTVLVFVVVNRLEDHSSYRPYEDNEFTFGQELEERERRERRRERSEDRRRRVDDYDDDDERPRRQRDEEDDDRRGRRREEDDDRDPPRPRRPRDDF